MATNFPTSLDNFTNPVSGNTLDSPSHSLQHSDANDAIEAIEAKLGIGASSAGSATSGYVLTAGTGGTTTWSALPDSGGLIPIVPTSVSVGSGSGSANSVGMVTFSGASSVSLNGVFSATYENYRIVCLLTSASATTTTNFRFRTTSDDTGTNYYGASSGVNWSNTAVNSNLITQSSFIVARHKHTDMHYSNFVYDCLRPFRSGEYTTLLGGHSGVLTDTPYYNYGALWSVTATQFTGFTVFPGSGTLGGIISVYGYKD